MKIPYGLFLLLLGTTALPAQSVLLTDIVVYSTDASGNATGAGFSTDPGTNSYSLFARSGGAWLDGGKSGPAPSIDLSSPGTYTYSLYMDSYGGGLGANTNAGISLYFNGVTANPGLSALIPYPNSSSAPTASSATVNNVFFSGFVAGAGTTTFVSGSTLVTLTDFTYSQGAVDLVNRNTAVPGDWNDLVGSITLQVAAVPEPASYVAIISLGALGFVGWHRRKSAAGG